MKYSGYQEPALIIGPDLERLSSPFFTAISPSASSSTVAFAARTISSGHFFVPSWLNDHDFFRSALRNIMAETVNRAATKRRVAFIPIY